MDRLNGYFGRRRCRLASLVSYSDLDEIISPLVGEFSWGKKIGLSLTKENITGWNQPFDGTIVNKDVEEGFVGPGVCEGNAPAVGGSTTAYV